MKLIVGLGNPGLEYELNRHNIGFRILDEFALAKKGTLKYKGKFHAEIAEIDSYDEPVVLMKPQTFMNRSAKAIVPFIRYFKIDQHLVRHFVYYVACLLSPPHFLCSQIITPFNLNQSETRLEF